jgi:hypothetical protein
MLEIHQTQTSPSLRNMSFYHLVGRLLWDVTGPILTIIRLIYGSFRCSDLVFNILCRHLSPGELASVILCLLEGDGSFRP